MEKLTIKQYTAKYGGSDQHIRRLIRDNKFGTLNTWGILSYELIGKTILMEVDPVIADKKNE